MLQLHPNGFLQFDLPDGKRLHIWDPDLPKSQDPQTPIHDHTFTFESEVVLGTLAHETYQAAAERFGNSEGMTHRVWAVNDDGLLIPTARTVVLQVAPLTLIGTGSTYTFGGPGNYHDTHGLRDTLTATIMRKVTTGLAPNPEVVVPLGVEPDNAFRRDQYPDTQLWPFVDRVLSLLAARGGKYESYLSSSASR